MEIVKTIRRMLALREGIRRCHILETDGRYDEIWDRLNDKYEVLLKQLRSYRRNRACYGSRQVDLACRLLGVKYYNL
jgi:hypothetical protein